MHTNHIIIGLGGIGGKGLKSFRRILIKDVFKKEIADKFPVGYIYVDTDKLDLEAGWTEELGVDYSIQDYAKVNTREGIEFEFIRDNLNSKYPNIKPWFGDIAIWNNLSVSTEKGAGQLRKLGRIYFAANVSGQSDKSFNKSLVSVFENVSTISEHTDDNVFHIISGLSGGTGSGSLIDVISQITAFVKNKNYNAKILIYAILPEKNEKKGKDILGFYYPNAYACLKELNAIGLKKDQGEPNEYYYRPYDVLKSSGFNGDRIDAKFDTCFIFQNENENGKKIEYEDALPFLVADFIFHTIFRLPTDIPAGQAAYQKLTENSVVISETDDFTNKEERAIKFASAAIKRIEIPETEIVDLFAAKIALQFFYQQRHNYWRDGDGFVNTKSDDDTIKYIDNARGTNLLIKCDFTLEKLSLKSVVQQSDKDMNYAQSDNEWMTLSNNLLNRAQKKFDQEGEKQPITWLSKHYDNYYNNEFRGMGVEQYWNRKNSDIPHVVEHFYNKIEKSLFELWIKDSDGNVLGLNQIVTVIGHIKTALNDLRNKAITNILHLNNAKNDSLKPEETIKGCEEKIKIHIQKFGKWYKRKSPILENVNGLICTYNKNKTDVIAFQFALEVTIKLIEKIDEIEKIIPKIINNIDSAQKKVIEKEAERKKALNNGDEKSYAAKNIKKLYKNNSFDTCYNNVIFQKDVFKYEIDILRYQISKEVPTKHFADLLKKLQIDYLQNEFLYVTRNIVPDIFREIETRVGNTYFRDKLIGNNVLQYIKEEYNTQEDLEKFLYDIKGTIGVYAEINKPEDRGENPDYGNYVIVIQHPTFAQDQEYERKFSETLMAQFTIGDRAPVILSSDLKLNEITIFKAKVNLALRTFDFVRNMLHDKYTAIDEGTRVTVERAKLTLHTEGDEINHFIKIIEYNDNEKKVAWNEEFNQDVLPYILFGLAKKIIKKAPKTGTYYLDLIDKFEIINISNNKASLLEINDFLFNYDYESTIRPIELLHDRIINEIKAIFPKKNRQKEELEKDLQIIKEEIIPELRKDEFNDDPSDIDFQIILKAAKKLCDKLLLT